MTETTLEIKTEQGQHALERMLESARLIGATADQMSRFIQAGYVPQLKQLEFHAAARLADEPEQADQLGFGGARGGGKSHTVFAQIALDDCKRMPGLKCLYLRSIGKKAREQMEDLRRAVLQNTPHKYNHTTGEIVFPNGSRIITGHFRAEKDVDQYLGIEYDVIAIEEANTLTRSKRQALRNSNRTSKAGWRPRLYLTFNPGGVGHADIRREFIEPYRKQAEKYTRFIPSTVENNRFVDPDYKRKLEENTGWMLRAYRYGDFDIAAGQYFSNWNYDTHVIKPFDIPGNWTVWGGLDYGFTHYTTAYIAAKDNNGNIYIIGEHAERKQLVQHHANAIKGLVRRVLNDSNTGRAGEWDRIGVFVAGADVFGKRGAERTVADQYAENGIELTAANDDRISGATTMLGLLGDNNKSIASRLFVFDTCPMLAEQMQAMQHDPHRPEDVLKIDADDDGVGGDDAYDGARYTVMAAERMGASFSFSYVR